MEGDGTMCCRPQISFWIKYQFLRSSVFSALSRQTFFLTFTRNLIWICKQLAKSLQLLTVFFLPNIRHSFIFSYESYRLIFMSPHVLFIILLHFLRSKNQNFYLVCLHYYRPTINIFRSEHCVHSYSPNPCRFLTTVICKPKNNFCQQQKVVQL